MISILVDLLSSLQWLLVSIKTPKSFNYKTVKSSVRLEVLNFLFEADYYYMIIYVLSMEIFSSRRFFSCTESAGVLFAFTITGVLEIDISGSL